MRLDGGDLEEEGRAYVTIEDERDELARERRFRVRRMRTPANNGVRYRWLGSRIMSCIIELMRSSRKD